MRTKKLVPEDLSFVRCLRYHSVQNARVLEAISKIGFWFQIAAGPSLKPQATCGLSRI
jgi:hypothetical protein